VVSNETDNNTFGPSASLFTTHTWHIGSAGITNIQVIIVAVAVVAAILIDVVVQRTRYGRAIRSVAYDPQTSGLLGINVNRLAIVTMFIAGALAGLAGVLLAVNLGGEDPSTGQEYLLTGFAILIVGGVGSIRGAVSAAYLIAIAETAVIAYGPSQWEDGVSFLLILLVLLLRPQGLFARARFQRT
jgi:branched-chain amino acid transport system permease protein